MSKSLIVVFSWSGNCMKIAERIREATGADLFRLEAEDPYPTEYKPTEARVIEEVTNDVMVPYVGDVEGWENYDTVFIGYPVWGYTIPQILKKFLLDHDWSGKRIAPFNSHLGSGEGGTHATIAACAPGAEMLEGVVIGGKMVGMQLGKAEKWARKVVG